MKKLLFILFTFIFILGAFETANATDWLVTKSTNSNDGVCNADCSLGEAVAVSASGDRVIFNSNLIGQTFTLDGTPITYSGKRIEIDGNIDGVNVVFLSGGNTSNHFDVTDNGSLTLKNMILAQGGGSQRGSILAFNSTLSLDRVAIRNNSGVAVGAIHSVGRLFLRNCTITGNEGNRGGGIVLIGIGPSSGFDVGNSIIAGNSADQTGQDIWFANPDANVISRGGNLIGDSDTIPAGIFTQTNDQMNVSPLLGPVNANQGGHPVVTHPLQAGSPAINTGLNAVAVDPFSAAPLTTDARGAGFMRIVSIVDKGAFETLIPTAAAVSVSGKVFDGEGNPASKAKVYMTDSQGITRTATTNNFGNFTFEDVLAGET